MRLFQLHSFEDTPDGRFLAAAVFLSCFLLSLISGSLIIQPQGTKAVTGLGLADNPSMQFHTSSTAVNIDATPTPSGALASSSHNLIVITNVSTGYNIALSTLAAPALAATSGSITSPTPLANNTWGYALARTDAVGVTNDFDTSYAVPTPSISSKWANPSANSIITKTKSAATYDITTVYYAAKTDMTLPSGTYANTVRYTATANIADIPAPTIISVSPSSGSTTGGTAIQIVGTGFTVNDESVTTAVTVGGNDCTGVSISSNTPSTGQDTIYCNTAAHAAGAVDVAVNTWSGTATSTDGYTYVVPANVTFVSPNVASTIAGSESGPAFTIVGTNFTGATSVTIGGTACASFQIVSNTQIFCKGPNSISATGNKAIAVSKSGVNSTGTANIAYTSTAYPTLQGGNAYANCSTTAKLYRDERDSQLYYVKRMPDNKCWMIDNLKYANYGDLSQETGKYLTADGTNTAAASNFDIPKYADLGATDYCVGSTDMPTNTVTRCGLSYNWYAATNGTGTYDQTADGVQATGSICPANFHLPSVSSYNDSASAVTADFPVLNASMNAGSLQPGSNDNSLIAGWQPSGMFGGLYSGGWFDDATDVASANYLWASMGHSSSTFPLENVGHARSIAVYGEIGVAGYKNKVELDGMYSVSYQSYGSAIRCVMDAPPTPPEGSNPGNITGTNPAALDVYPTTGWAGDTVAITSNALFTNVTGVTISGTACAAWGVINSSLVTCKLPAKTAGTTNVIAVTNNGSNVTNAGIYTHMKITYFDPNASTVSIGGTTYDYYPNGFTSANCSSMTANNTVIGSTPAASLAYVRDTRNNQTYKVKKMVDNKCWMVDNLKYISSDMTFNGGDHLNNGGTTAYNTVNEFSTQSTANSDKAFYNNPMSNSYCYSTANMPINSLTRCGYLYNWYAATGGTGTYAQSTNGTNVTGSICPANFRLPSAMSNGSTATSNGTSYGAADFTVLNASMNAGSLATGSTIGSYYAGWQPSGAWGGTFSGNRDTALYNMGSYGYFWSSTVDSATYARNLSFSSSFVGSGSSHLKYGGLSIRCLIP